MEGGRQAEKEGGRKGGREGGTPSKVLTASGAPETVLFSKFIV